MLAVGANEVRIVRIEVIGDDPDFDARTIGQIMRSRLYGPWLELDVHAGWMPRGEL